MFKRRKSLNPTQVCQGAIQTVASGAASKSRHSALDAESPQMQFAYQGIAGMLNLIQYRNDTRSFNTFETA
jgi:hypothetical protein